jgi:crossover junction endodeoxyribonuclease RusA
MIVLPWPHKDLSPNSRKHRMAVAPLRKAARACAAWECKGAKMNFAHLAETGLHLRITFNPPDRRRRDLDNMLASIKSHLDGVADVIGVDDSKWGLTLCRGEVVKGGAVVVEVVDRQGAPMTGGAV